MTKEDCRVLRQINMKLNNDWNELEEWLKERMEISATDTTTYGNMTFMSQNHAVYRNILDKMREIKEGKNET